MVASRNLSPWSVCAFCLGLVLIVGLSLATPAYGQGTGQTLEKEAQAIDKMIMCPVCPAETIDQAQVEISFQMRAVIREMLAEGKTREEVLDYFVDRYGADILAAPPKSGTNLLAWILPIVAVAAGLVGVFLVIRSMTGRQRPATATAVASSAPSPPQPVQQLDDPELAPFMAIADRLLASRRSSLTGNPPASLPAMAQDSSTDGDPPSGGNDDSLGSSGSNG